jgi:hypothetical protein
MLASAKNITHYYLHLLFIFLGPETAVDYRQRLGMGKSGSCAASGVTHFRVIRVKFIQMLR